MTDPNFIPLSAALTPLELAQLAVGFRKAGLTAQAVSHIYQYGRKPRGPQAPYLTGPDNPLWHWIIARDPRRVANGRHPYPPYNPTDPATETDATAPSIAASVHPVRHQQRNYAVSGYFIYVNDVGGDAQRRQRATASDGNLCETLIAAWRLAQANGWRFPANTAQATAATCNALR